MMSLKTVALDSQEKKNFSKEFPNPTYSLKSNIVLT